MDPDISLQQLKSEIDELRREIQLRNIELPKQLDPTTQMILEDASAIHYTTTAPTYTPRNYGTRELYDDATDHYLKIYTPDGWQQLLLNGVLKLAAGTGISLSPSDGRGTVTVTNSAILAANAVLGTRAGDAATGQVSYAHGLGKTPALTVIIANWASGTPELLHSTGYYAGSTQGYVATWTRVGLGGGNAQGSDAVVNISDHAGNSMIGAINAVNGTNVVIDWSKGGAGVGATNIDLLILTIG